MAEDGDEGKVVPLRRDNCPCGWLAPRDVKISGIFFFTASDVEVDMTCPVCQRRLTMTGKKNQQHLTS